MSDRRIEPEDDLRTRARERAYREFMAPAEGPDAREAAAAEERLRVALEREIGVPLGGAGAGPGLAGADAAAPTSPRGASGTGGRARRGFLDFLLAPAWRPAFAVVLVVAAGALIYASLPGRNEPPVMRGPEPVLQEGEIALVAPARGPGGSLRLGWSAAPEAERYDVLFLSPDLTEIARVADLAGTTLELSAAALPPGLAPGADVLYRVVAMRGSDEIARSRTLALTLPGL